MLDPLYHLAAGAIVFFHKGFGPVFGQESFFAWAFSVILLVVCVRIVIFPLFVKQVKSQRTMQMLQPRIKELREKYKNDKPRMQQEIMALQREHGNPLLGCLPIVLQIPLFIALFHVFKSLVPRKLAGGGYHYVATVGLSADTVRQISSAKLFGVSLSSAFTSPADILKFLGADGGHVKIFAVILIVLMGLTTFFTQKQIMARSGPVDPQQERIQKILLYVSPLFLTIFGFRFPVAVLLYWLTTNLWSMGQQFFVIRRMPPVLPGPGAKLAAAGGKGAPPARGGPPAKPGRAVTNAGNGAKAVGAKGAKGTAKGPDAAANGTSPNLTKGSGGTSPNLAKGGAAAARKGKGTGEPAAPDAEPIPEVDGAGRSNGSGRPRPPADGTPRPPAPVAAGNRRPAGNRPSKARAKGQRRGGRH